MSAGVVQLTARGVQDAYLNGKPDVSYFVGIYRRHSQFALQTVEYPFDSQVNFGDSAKVKIPYKGDLILGTSLKVILPALTQTTTTSSGWTQTAEIVNPSFVFDYINRTKYGNGIYVKVNVDNIDNFDPIPTHWGINYSTDNINWTHINIDNYVFNGITFVDGYFAINACLLVGVNTQNSDIVYYSSDGKIWIKQGPNFITSFSDGASIFTNTRPAGYSFPSIFSNVIPYTTKYNSITYGNKTFVGVGSGTYVSYSLDNGNTWTPGTIDPYAWVSVVYGNGYFVSVSNDGHSSYSLDGKTWSNGIIGNHNWTSITFGSNSFLTVSSDGNAAYSTDAKSWISSPISSNYSWSNVTYGNNMFVAISTSGYVGYTYDVRDTWIISEVKCPFDYSPYVPITYVNGYFVAFNAYNYYYTTDITQPWTSCSISSNYWISITYGNGYYVFVSLDGHISYSTDIKIGGPVYLISSIHNLNCITFGGDYFVITATDGFTAHTSNVTSSIWHDQLLQDSVTLICSSFTNQSAFYATNPYVSIQNPPTLSIGDVIYGLPYSAKVYSTISSVTVNNQIYYKFTANLINSQTILPITIPITITVSGVTMNVISASTLNWVNDDLMYQQLDFANHINFRSLYPAIQTYTNLYLPVDLPLPGTNIPTIVSAGTVMSGFTNYSLTFGALYGAFYTTPIRVNSGELFRTPLPVTISTFGTATANTSCNPHCMDFSNSYIEFSNINFNLNNLSILGVGNVTGQLSSTLLTVPTSLQPLYTVFTMDTTAGLQNLANFDWLQVPYGYQYTGGDYVPGTTVTLSYGATVIATAVAYIHTVDVDDFGSIPLPQGTVFVVVGQVSFVPLTPIYGLAVGAAVSGPGHMQFIYSLACTIQPVFPITSPASVTLDNGYDSGTVNFVSYTPIYQTNLTFPSSQICTFWGFDSGTLLNQQILPPTSTQTITQFNSFPVSSLTTLQSGAVSGGIDTQAIPSYINCVGTALINTVEFLIGGQLIESLTGEYIQNALDLKTSLQNKPALTIIYGKDDSSPAYAPRTYIIPLPFYFYRESGLAVPLVSLYRQDVEVRFTFNYAGLNANSGNSINIQPYVNVPADSLQVSLVVDYAFLTGPELDYFRNKKLDYLITQVQLFQQILPINSIGGTYTVYFVNPVIELQVLVRNNANIPDYFDYSNNGLQNMALYFNGQTVFSAEAIDDTYLGTIEILNKHKYVAFAKGTTSSNVYVYSFSTNPDTPTVPSGHVNMSRIKQQVLEVNLTPDAHQKQLSIYAINYNMLRVQFGLGGLLFNSSQ